MSVVQLASEEMKRCMREKENNFIISQVVTSFNLARRSATRGDDARCGLPIRWDIPTPPFGRYQPPSDLAEARVRVCFRVVSGLEQAVGRGLLVE